MKKALLSCFLIALAFLDRSAFAEGSWLADIPKADRAKIAAAFSSLGSIQKKIREDHAGAVRHEAQYAKKARFLARSLDIAASAAMADEEKKGSLLASLTDQRRLRWESAVDLSDGRYGRAGTAGFETVSVYESRLATEGSALSAKLQKYLPKLRRQAAAALLSDFETRAAAHPDCPDAAFAELRAAASALGAADKRRWTLALASGLPRAPLTAFPERLASAEGEAPAQTADARFSELLRKYKLVLESAAAFRKVLPAAAAAAWYVDAPYAPLPANAASSVAAFAEYLSSSEPEDVSLAAAEFPGLDAALSEYASLVWIVRRLKPAAFKADFGIEVQAIEDALRVVWRMKVGSETGIAPESALKMPAIRAAERMSQFLAGTPSDSEVLAAFAALRDDPAALHAFAAGSRYAEDRERVNEALASSFDAAQQAADVPSRPSVRVLDLAVSPFGPFALSASASDGRFVAPAQFAPEYALSLASSFGLSAGGKAIAAATWLESKGIFFSVPSLSHSTPPSPEELDALTDGTCFYPAAGAGADSSAARNRFVRERLSAEATRIGVPFRFIDSPSEEARMFAVFSAGPARYAELARMRSRE